MENTTCFRSLSKITQSIQNIADRSGQTYEEALESTIKEFVRLNPDVPQSSCQLIRQAFSKTQ